MKVVLALVFGALVQGQTAPVAANPAPLPRPAASPVAGVAPPRSGSSANATALKDRQFFVANPIMDAMLVSTLAPKTSTSASTADSTSTSTSSSSDLTNTLLMASMLNSGNQQKRQPPRRQYSQPPQYIQTSGPQYAPQYVQASGQYAQVSGPQYTQTSVSTQFAPVQTFQQQPQYFAPAPQPRYASAPQRSYHNDGYGYDSGSQRDDPLKKMVLLNGVMSGNVNPMAAVALDNNNKMSSTDALVVSSMGNTPLSTMLAVGAGSGSGGSSGNMLSTLVMANALAPKSTSATTSASTNSNSALNTLATLSVLGSSSGSQSGSGSGGLFGNLFGGN